jgi:hypothetical protein
MATGPAGKGWPASNAGQRHRTDDDVGHQLQAETLLDAGLISRYGVPPAGNPADRSRAVPLLDPGNRGPWRRAPLHRLPIVTVNQTQLLSVLVDVNDIETSDPPRHPDAPALARPGSEGAGRLGVSAALRWSSCGRTHPVDAAGDRRCRRHRRGGPSVPAEEVIAPQSHTGGLSAPNSRPWAGPWAGSPPTSVPGRRHYPPASGSDPARGRA